MINLIPENPKVMGFEHPTNHQQYISLASVDHVLSLMLLNNTREGNLQYDEILEYVRDYFRTLKWR